MKRVLQMCAVYLVTSAVLVVPYFVAEAQQAVINNPLKDIHSIPQFIMRVVDVVLMVATPLIAVFLMYAGFLFVSAKGNEQQITKAKSVFLWSCIGAAVILGAKIFSYAIQGTIDSLR